MSATSVDTRAGADYLDDLALYDGVLTRRVIGFCIDYVIVALWTIPVAVLVFFLGVLTFGLGWMLYGVLVPLVVFGYVWKTLGGPSQATVGMRWMGVRLERLDGARIDGPTAVLHTALFWAGNVFLTPLILLATLFTDRKRTVHDLLLGTLATRIHP